VEERKNELNPLMVLQEKLLRKKNELRDTAVQLEQTYQQVMGKIALIDEVLKWNLDEIIIEKEKHDRSD
jgi:hypothetical protein